MEILKVLIVDDERIIVKGLENLYDWVQNGFQVIGKAFNGQSGIELAKKVKPDIVLTDIRMPKVSGLEMILVLKKEMPQMEFIVISGYNDFSYCQEALRLGASDYLLKPIDYQMLHNKLIEVRKKIEKEKELTMMADEGQSLKRTELFKKLIHKPEINISDMQIMEGLGIDQNNLFCVVLMKNNEQDVEASICSIDKRQDAESINNFGHLVFNDLDNIVIIIWHKEKEYLESVEFRESLVSLTPDSLSQSIGVGPVMDLINIGESYLGALEIIKARESVDSNQMISKLKNYINEHYSEAVSLQTLADISNMTPFYVSRFFKEKTGKNFTGYLQEMRIGKAKELLLKTDLSVSEISEKIGYGDYRVFIKTFKKNCGITPKQYKKKLETKARESR